MKYESEENKKLKFINNPSNTENLVTVMWANEIFDPAYPDTYGDPLIK